MLRLTCTTSLVIPRFLNSSFTVKCVQRCPISVTVAFGRIIGEKKDKLECAFFKRVTSILHSATCRYFIIHMTESG
jgi:hypothetical protein